MKTVLLLVAMSVMGAAVRSEASCLRTDSGKIGCVYNPSSVLPRTINKEATLWFAEEQGDGYCLYRKEELSEQQSQLGFEKRLRLMIYTRVSYELAPISTVEQIESQGSRAIAKSVTASDVLSVLHEEGVTDIFHALHVSEALDYVLSGNVAIKEQRTCSTGLRPLFGRHKVIGPICSMREDNDPSSVLLGKIVKGIIKAAETSEDSASCAKQSQI